MSSPRPVVLCILDGWGIADRPDFSAPDQAATPNMDRLRRDCPGATLITYGPDVGLPRGQMGNSEVGHTNIGAGRVVAMDLGQIDLAIEDGSFFQNPGIRTFVDRLRAVGGTAHLMGVVSDGGVHGHIAHVVAACKAVADQGLPVVLHTPSEVKAAVTGNGRADKAQVGAMVARLLRLGEAPKPADAADALALAICHLWRAPAQDRRAAAVAVR